MSLLFYDGFDHYATADITTKWDVMMNCTIGSGNGRNGGNALFGLDQGVNRYVSKTVAPTSPTLILGFGINMTNVLDSISRFMFIYDPAGTIQFSMYMQPSGVLNFYRGQGAALLGSTSAALTTGNYVYVEMKLLVDDAVGTLEVRFNGTPVLGPLTGLDTKQSAVPGWASVQLGAYGGDSYNGRFNIDDVYICDGAGAAPYNTFLGPVRVVTTFADAAGSTTQMTPSAGANYACVNENPHNGDTSYVTETVVGERDTYNFAALGVAGTVLAVQTNIMARSAGAGSETIAPVVKIGATNYVGPAIGLSSSYLDRRQIYTASPATAAPWTTAEIDAAEFGVQLVS